MNRKQRWIILLVTIFVASIHSFIPEQYLTLHITLRLLYFIPIIYAALHNGRKGGVIVALAISLIFLPHFLIKGASPEFIAGNIVAIVLFNLSGFFFGTFRESSEHELVKRIQKNQIIPGKGEAQQKVLFYIDGTPLSLSAAEWFSNRTWVAGLSLVLLAVSTRSREEITADQMAGRTEIDSEEGTSKMVHEIHGIFTKQGVNADDIRIVSASINEKVPISTKVIEYAEKHDVDVILLCKHNKKKSEEFLFGDTAIQVVRKTSKPVMIVKGVEDQLVLA